MLEKSSHHECSPSFTQGPLGAAGAPGFPGGPGPKVPVLSLPATSLTSLYLLPQKNRCKHNQALNTLYFLFQYCLSPNTKHIFIFPTIFLFFNAHIFK